MITPIELQSKNFRNGIGYDKKDVDGFIGEILASYEAMYKENMELNDKIHTLNEGLSYYKSIEKTLQKALILAEQTAEETKETARLHAKAIEAEAKEQAKLIVADAKHEYNKLREKTVQLIQQYESYKTQFKHLAAAQCELLESKAFQIQIADLDAFAEHKIDVQAVEEQKKERNETFIVRESAATQEASSMKEEELDDFEFLDASE